MKWEDRLTSTNLTIQCNINFDPTCVIVLNNSPYAVLMRRGVAALPTNDSFDYIIPGGMYTIIPVVGHEFSFVLDILPGTGSNVKYQPAAIIFLSKDETIPNFTLSTYRDVYSVNQNAGFNQVIDTRGARAISMELSYIPPNPAFFQGSINAGFLGIYAVDPTGATRLLRVVNTPYNAVITRAVIPITSPQIQIVWTPLQAGPVTLEYTLLDQIPDIQPRYATNQRGRASAGPATYPVGVSTTLFDDYMRGAVRSLDVSFIIATGDPFRFYFSMYSYNSSPAGFGSTIFSAKIFNNETSAVTSLEKYTGRCEQFLTDVFINPAGLGFDYYKYSFPMDFYIPERLRVTVIPQLTFSNLFPSVQYDLELT